jgi:hypothetical protein
VIGTFDLDGEGKLEIVVHSQYYEGEMTTIYKCDPWIFVSLASATFSLSADALK